MQYSTLAVAALSLLSSQANAKTVRIEVGSSGASFSPNSVTASVGDILEYHFAGGKHSVVRGDFSKGCSPTNNGGFYSGFLKSGAVFQVAVNNTDPIFFYCSSGKHCQNGMVGVVNPSSDQTLDKYKSAAKSSKNNVSPDSPYGGLGASSDKTSAAGHTNQLGESQLLLPRPQQLLLKVWPRSYTSGSWWIYLKTFIL